ncbi:MAG: pentapeptide repeat-containing protein, partial [Gammaproteobacteria bacterium]|nr:pentapeptide repeat-containing protein [Gammaproteobacteria bacterium]
LETDCVSPDKDTWTAISAIPELFPEALRLALDNPGDDKLQARLEAARRWADERENPHPVPPNGKERRRVRTVAARHVPQAARAEGLSGKNKFQQYSIVALILLFVMTIPFLMPSREESVHSACGDSPAPGVNWSNCLLQGGQFANADLENAIIRNTDLSGANLRASNLQSVDLSYTNLSLSNLRGANLSGANLVGANLRGARLTDARIENTDLSYAILTSADLDGAALKGARLDHAKWTDELLCMPGSIGQCLLAREIEQ